MAKKKLAIASLLVTGTLPAFATSTTAVSATAGTNSCSQANTFTSSCSVSQVGTSQTATASAFANATWATDGTGLLEATANDFGPGTTSTGTIQWSLALIIAGASGSGDLQVTFNGFQMNIVNTPGQHPSRRRYSRLERSRLT